MTTVVGTPPGVTASGFRVTPPPIPATGLQLWLDADHPGSFTYSSGAVVSQWRDRSGANHHAARITGSPTRDATINTRSAVRFSVGDCRLRINSFASAYTAGEIFAITDLITVTASNGGIWYGIAANGESPYYPYAGNGLIYENFGSTVRASFDPVVSLLNPHAYNVRSAPGSYIAAIDGISRYTSATNTVGFGANPFDITSAVGSIDGSIGEVIMYDRVLTTPERQQVEQYLQTKWGIV